MRGRHVEVVSNTHKRFHMVLFISILWLSGVFCSGNHLLYLMLLPFTIDHIALLRVTPGPTSATWVSGHLLWRMWAKSVCTWAGILLKQRNDINKCMTSLDICKICRYPRGYVHRYLLDHRNFHWCLTRHWAKMSWVQTSLMSLSHTWRIGD